MPIPWSMAVAIYFTVWWIVLFAILPWGVRSQSETGDVVPGSDPGAPKAPHLLVKAVWTSVVAAAVLLFILVLLAYE